MSAHVRLIGLDWGTSSLRAYLYDVDGRVVASRRHAWGIRQLPEGGYAAALQAITADWPPCIAVAAGMVGSRQGWLEVPYVDVPADAAAIAQGARRVEACDTHALWIFPGLRQQAPANVMRGEETQVVGALTQQPRRGAHARFVLPGTHSKWASVSDGRIVAFDTWMTGEIYALLLQHSILGAGVSVDHAKPLPGPAFERGLHDARASGDAGVFGRLFWVRALMLNGELAIEDVPDFLSGLLIGEEFRLASLRDRGDSAVPLCLIGDASLCQRYATAAAHFGYTAPTIVEDAAASGLWQLAWAAGLLAQAPSFGFFGVHA
ncbi:MAG TPA: 2-dehydro-3-deoxygalactonokinase [Dyella sp.]|uniref:2-dehydro-3-deoxygalactonokinase n=1 Tax=Dyella sp. TaxID=1869338 RepID=UPI002C33DCB2|nr:2-dehydro-3-deoxygalactonokinase [Dyella sp.]HTV84851.1 2-dehydro-3-deoxygalactonokinase [Dyella sp.]